MITGNYFNLKNVILTYWIILNVFQTSWIRFEGKESLFSVLVPGEMTHSSNMITTEIGDIEFHTYKYTPQQEDRNLLYMVYHYEYPDLILSTDTTEIIDEILETTIEDSVVKLSGTLDYSREIQYRDYPGILYRIKYNKGKAVVKCKAYIIRDEVYILQVYASIDNSLNDNMDYFLDSFQYHPNG